MASTSKRYPKELRDRAVRLVFESERAVAQVAADLGVGAESLRNWVKQAEADAGERAERLTSSEREELARLRGEPVDARRHLPSASSRRRFRPCGACDVRTPANPHRILAHELGPDRRRRVR
jgi:transposase